MGLVLILCWCSAVVGRWGGPNILPDNPRFGAFISRFGRREFPVYSATGISLHGVDLSYRFHDERAGIPEKSTKFPGSTGKTRYFCRPVGTGRGATSRQ